MDAGVEPLRYDRMQWATLIRQTVALLHAANAIDYLLTLVLRLNSLFLRKA